MSDKIKPGDLVMLDARFFTDEEIQKWGIGIFIAPADDPGSEGYYSRVYWINPERKADQGFSGWNERLCKLS